MIITLAQGVEPAQILYFGECHGCQAKYKCIKGDTVEVDIPEGRDSITMSNWKYIAGDRYINCEMEWCGYPVQMIIPPPDSP